MKKVFLMLLAILVCMSLLCSLVACDKDGDNGETGDSKENTENNNGAISKDNWNTMVAAANFENYTLDLQGSMSTYQNGELVVEAYPVHTIYRATKDAVEVTDEAVDAEIESVRKRNARTIDVTDRAVEDGDNVIFDFDGSVDGVAFEGGSAKKHDLLIGSGSFIPGFEDQMIGKNIGENFDVVVTFPEDYHAAELAGKEAVFKCYIHEIKKSEMPEFDDEFVKDVSEFDTIDEYKASIKATLTEKAEKAEDSKVDDQLIKAVCEKIEGEIPEVMFENEAENCIRDYENRLRYQGMDLDTFMKYTGQTMETLKTQFRPQAEQTVKTRLALEYIAKVENLTATEEEIATEYQKIADAYGIEVEKVKEGIASDAIADDVRVGKAVLLLRDYAVITVNEGASDVVEVEPEVVSAE